MEIENEMEMLILNMKCSTLIKERNPDEERVFLESMHEKLRNHLFEAPLDPIEISSIREELVSALKNYSIFFDCIVESKKSGGLPWDHEHSLKIFCDSILEEYINASDFDFLCKVYLLICEIIELIKKAEDVRC
jgi:hypothetical protein